MNEPGAAQPARGSLRDWLRYAAVLLVTGLVLYVLVDRLTGGQELLQTIFSASPGLTALAVLITLAGIALSVFRWQIVLGAMGYRVSYWRGLDSIMSTYPLTVVTPSRGNDFLRAFALRDLVPVYAATSATLAERAVDLWGLLLLAGIGAAVHGLWVWAAAMFGIALAELVVVVALLRARGWLTSLPLLRRRADKLDQLFRAFHALAERPKLLVLLLMVSLVIRVGVIGIGHTLLLAAGAELGFLDTLATFPIAVVIGLAPVTLAGMGTRDAAFVYLVRTSLGAGIPDATLLAATIGYSAIAFWGMALVGVPFMLRRLVRPVSPPRARTDESAAAGT